MVTIYYIVEYQLIIIIHEVGMPLFGFHGMTWNGF